jgi:hypothetical protein
MTDPRRHDDHEPAPAPGLTEEPRTPDRQGDRPAGDPDDNPDDLTVQGGE